MSRYFLYVSDQEGMVQARLALNLLRQANSIHQWRFQHGGAFSAETCADFDDILFLGKKDAQDVPSVEDGAKNGVSCTIAEAITNPQAVIAKLKHRADEIVITPTAEQPNPANLSAAPPTGAASNAHAEVADNAEHAKNNAAAGEENRPKRVIGVTSCPTGIAHTFMAAEGLQVGAEKLGYQVKIETQGSVGTDNPLTNGDIVDADVVIIAADTKVDLGRFVGKRLYQTTTKAAIQDGSAVIERALAQAKIYRGDGKSATLQAQNHLENQESQDEKTATASFYSHLMTGVSYMLPFVVAGGLLIALGFFFGSLQFGDQGIFIYEDQYRETFAATLFWIGKDAFALFVPILGGYIAYSQAGRVGLAPGMIGGYIAMNTGAGFLGAILAGFIAGWAVKKLNEIIKLPRSLEGLKPTLILPLLGAIIVGLMMYYIIGEPVAKLLAWLTASLQGLSNTSAGVLGLLLGMMMAFDMGGPVNKAAYTFATALIASQVYAPMAAVMAAGMTPPLAIFFATIVFKNRFTLEEREAGKAAGVLGLSFITEGAIPFAAKDPLRVIPALMAGSAVAAAISMAMGCLLRAPHGGIFVLFIPNAMSNLGWYLLALAAGTAVSCVLLGVLKKPLGTSENVIAE